MAGTETAWGRRACADLIYADLWTPPGDDVKNDCRAWKRPRELCLECPILADCRAWVLAQPEDPCPKSMVAGLTPSQREEKRRNGLRARCGTATGRKEHALLGEKPCDACRAARNANDRARAAS